MFIPLALFAALGVTTTTADYAFLSIGDWGSAQINSQDKYNVDTVAAQMATIADASKAQFILNTGDNFYWCGIQNTTDPQIKVDYEDPYSDPRLNMRWYGALGNHEYGYNVQAEIDYMQLNPNWYMPDRYYTHRIQLDSKNYATLLYLDTSPCISDYRNDNPQYWDPCSTQYPTCSQKNTDDDFEGECYFHQNILSQDCGVQFSWLKTTVWGIPADDWVIVVGHHPADEINVKDFTTVLQQRGFSIYLNGHTHLLNHYQIDGAGAYLTTGAGGLVDIPMSDKKASSKSFTTPDQEHPITKAKLNGMDVTPEMRAAHKKETGDRSVTYDTHTYQKLWSQTVAGFTLHTFNSDFTSLRTDFYSYDGTIIHTFTSNKQGDIISMGK